MTRQVSPASPHPVSGLMASASVYMTVSRSGEMCSPCSTVSSPTLTMAVISSAGSTSIMPRRRRAAPTPPASAAITVARRGVAGHGKPSAQDSGVTAWLRPGRRCARLPACRRSEPLPPIGAASPSPSTPRPFWADRPASACSALAPFLPSPPSRPSRCRPSPSAGVADGASSAGFRPPCRPSSGPCRRDRCMRPGPVSRCPRSNGSWANATWCTAPTSSSLRRRAPPGW